MDIKDLERLIADDPVSVLRVFYDLLSNSNSMSISSKTSDLFEELIAEIGLDDSIPIGIDDKYYDLEGDIQFFEQFLNEDTSSDVSPALLPTKSSLLVLPFPDPSQSGGKTRVMEIPSFGFHHMPSPRPAAYSPKEVMCRFYDPHLTSGDGFDHEIKSSSGVVAGPRFRCQMAGGLVPGINPEGSRIGYMAAFDRRIGCVVVVRGNGFQAND
nr:hypothetical protein [Tanacetum cinerariifolium]